MDYFGSLQVYVYVNDVQFKNDEYGDGRLLKVSVLQQFSADPNYPSWIGSEITKHVLMDETQFLQLGFIDEEEYEKF